MATSRPTGNLLDTLERHSRDIRRLKARVGAIIDVTDHGEQGGLLDDDHTQYLNVARHDADDHSGLLPIDHGTDVTGLLDDDHTQYHTDSRASTWHSGLAGAHVTNGDSHNHSGGDGATIDHGSLSGRGDNDHSQYALTSGDTFTGIVDFNSAIHANVINGIGIQHGGVDYFWEPNQTPDRYWINTPDGINFYIGPRAGGDHIGYMALRTDRLDVLATGGRAFDARSDNVYLTGARDNTTASSANTLIQALDGRIFRSTSALKYKTDVERADYLADIELVPTKHWRTDDEKWRYGLVADWLVDQDPLLGEHAETLDENTEVENYDTRAVLAIMAAKINRLEEKLATI